PPGASVPLGAVFATGSQRVAVGHVQTADSGAGLIDRYALLAVGDVSGVSTSAGFSLSGAVTNTTAVEMRQVILVGSVYNSASAVAGYRRIAIEQPLGPGASMSFSIILPGVSSAAR